MCTSAGENNTSNSPANFVLSQSTVTGPMSGGRGIGKSVTDGVQKLISCLKTNEEF